jgi:hypothetical protein
MTNKLYFLHVDIKLKNMGQADEFEAASCAFLTNGGFRSVEDSGDLHYISPARLLRVKSGTPAKTRPDYVNLWTVPDVSGLDLAELMNDSHDNQDYEKINEFVRDERQEFIYFDANAVFKAEIARGETPPPDDPRRQLMKTIRRRAGVDPRAPAVLSESHDESKFIRVIHHFPETTSYADYGTQAIEFVVYMENAGWYSTGIFWNVTGQLNTFTEFWQVPNSVDNAGLGTMLEAAKAGGAPEDLRTTYANLPQTSRLLLVEYAKGPLWQPATH